MGVRESVFGLATACLLAAGCAFNPASGRPEVVLMSRGREGELGKEEAQKVAAMMGLIEDPALTSYVRTVGQRLVEHAPPHDTAYTFAVVDAPEPNAFALPGGYVYVSRGLLALMNGEDELAGVLGHEIGHVVARHAVRRVTRAAPLAVLTGLGAAVTGIVSPTLGDLVGGVGGLAGALVLAPYSRGQENEADRLGQEMAAKAGWDPKGLSRALESLEREEALHADGSRPTSFLATHPPLPNRVEDTEARASTLQRGAPAAIAASNAAFVRKLDGLLVGTDPAGGVVDKERFSHPDFDFALRFPSGWQVQNGREAVAGVSPDRDAMLILESAGKGSNPAASLAAFEREAKVELASRAEPLRINGLSAVRTTAMARTRDGRLALDLTWIAHGGNVYRVTGATAPARSDAFQGPFREATGSFRPLTAAERAAFREIRLRTVTARDGETIAQLASRAGSTWDARMTAVANALETESRPGPNRPVKVARAEPYRPR